VRFRSVFIIATALAIAGSSCKQKGGKYIDQGEIHYNIEYVGDMGVP